MAVMPIGDLIGWQAMRRPHDPALTCEDQTLSWAALEQRTNRLARAYQQRGVAQDDLVTIALPNSVAFYEAAIEAHPQVRSCAVIGLPDEEMGARIHAIVDAYEAIGDDELFAHLAERLVRYKIPESFEYVEEPLRGENGKVRRSALRAARIDSH